jgi:uncharacterized membrane protein
MKINYLAVVVLAILFSACSNSNNQNTSHTIKKETSVNPEKTYKGLLSINRNERYFMDCDNPDKYYLVEDQSGTIDSFYRLAWFQSYEGEGVYCELNGMLDETKRTGTYNDGVLTVKSIIKTEPKNFRNTCIPYEYWGLGTEPFWYIQISQKEKIIDWKDGGKGITHRFEYVAPVISGNTITYYSKEMQTAYSVKIEIEQRPCSDGMSELTYEYEVTFTYDSETYTGCAIQIENLFSFN